MKKIIKYALIGLGLFLFSQKMTLASSRFELEQDPNTLTYKIERTDKTVQLYFYIVRDKETKEFVYCLEPGVQLSEETYEELEEWEYQKLHLTEKQKEYISKVAYYGYHYKGHNHIYYYYAAQLLIWESIIPSEWRIYYTDHLGGNKVEWFQKERNEILKLIEEEEKLPSIAGENFTWNLNDTLTIFDSHELLKEYHVTSSTNALVMQEQNQLKITSKEAKKETITFQKDYEGNALKFYYREDGQNTMRTGKISPKKFQITVEPYTLNLEILKQDEKKNPILNVTFGLYAKEDIKNVEGKVVFAKDSLVAMKTTNQEGKLVFSNLYEGVYVLKEENVPDQYEKLEKEIEVIITKEKPKQQLTIINKEKKQNLIIKKQDEESSEILAHVRFQIWNETECIFDGYTNEFGIIELENMPLGNYKIVEIETLLGYELAKNPTYFTLNGEKESLSIIITNKKIENVPNTKENSYQKNPIYEKKRKYL